MGVIQAIKNQDNDPRALPVEHFFAEQQYVRVLHIPKGVLLVGRMHKGKTLNLLLTGRVYVYLRGESEGQYYDAPCFFESEAMGQKVIYAEVDSKFATIQVTDEKDPEIIEELTMVPEDEVEDFTIPSRVLKMLGAK